MRRQAHICLHGLLCLGFGICLFPSLLSFALLIGFAPRSCCGMLSEVLQRDEWYQRIFLLAVYWLDVFEQRVYTFGLSLSPRFRSASEQKQHLYLDSFFLAHLHFVFFFCFFCNWNVRHLFSFSVFLSPFGLIQILASFWPQNPSQILLAKESWSFIVIFGECKGYKQITKLEKCCTHGMPSVLFWSHEILKSGVAREFMHAHTLIFMNPHIKRVCACPCTQTQITSMKRRNRGHGGDKEGQTQQSALSRDGIARNSFVTRLNRGPTFKRTPQSTNICGTVGCDPVFHTCRLYHCTDVTLYSGWSFKLQVF